MAKADDMLQTFDELISDGVRRGLLHNIAEDDDIAGLVDVLADALPRALAEEGESVTTLRRAFHRQLDNNRPLLPAAA